MTSKNQLTLGYWDIRGFAEPVRLLLHYTKTPFTNKLYPVGDAPNFKRDEWLKDKNSLGLDFPNLPYLIDGDLKLSQARTILTHLGRKFNLIGNNERETALIELLLDQSNDLRQELNNVCYRAINFDSVRKKFCTETLPIHLKLFEAFLVRHKKKWLISDTLTIADFQFFEYLDHCWLISNNNWADYPKILAYMKAFRELPELQKYLHNEHAKRPMNGKMAKFGDTLVQHEEKSEECEKPADVDLL